MYQDRIKDILNRLAPPEAIIPVEPNKVRPLIVDDTAEDEASRRLFLTRLEDESNTRTLLPEKLSIGFVQGLQLLDTENVTNIGHLALWKPSSYKQGNPIENALDDNPETFWQSDGLQPHTLDISFSKRMNISLIALYFSLISDESYTPSLVKLYVGHCAADALLYKMLEIRSVNGWVALTFEDNREDDRLLKCQFIRIVFPINHENGKDTHLRGIRVYSPSRKISAESADWVRSFEAGSTFLTECSLR